MNSGEYDGLDYRGAFDALAARFERDGSGARRVNCRLRDWGVSRQRYWGCPIPIIYCAKCGAVPVPEDQLPVVLPEDVAFTGVQSPIKADPGMAQDDLPAVRRRRPSARPTRSTRSWSRAGTTRATRVPGANDMVDARANYWLPVDQYIGGIEHAILHLLYFRFYHKLLRDEGLVHSDEPATNLLCQGMVIAETFYRENATARRRGSIPADVEIQRDERARVVGAVLKADGQPVEIGGIEKMSKSKNNGVDPQTMVDKYGADTVRLFSMFAAPPDQSLEWNEAGVEGMARFLRRFWREVTTHAASPDHPDVDASDIECARRRRCAGRSHETIQKVSDDIGRRYAFNTAIAALMELLNALGKFDDASDQGRAVRHEALEAMVLLLNPVTPHICHALWQVLGIDRPMTADRRSAVAAAPMPAALAQGHA